MKRPVLIVEDDPACLQMLGTLFSQNGYRTVTAPNCAEALVRARETQPCLVLLDLTMPFMDGVRFRTAQQQDPSLADIPVVLISAHHGVDEIGRRLGARGFILKTVDARRPPDGIDSRPRPS